MLFTRIKKFEQFWIFCVSFIIRLIVSEITKYFTKTHTNAKRLIFAEKLNFMHTLVKLHKLSLSEVKTSLFMNGEIAKKFAFGKIKNLIGFHRNFATYPY